MKNKRERILDFMVIIIISSVMLYTIYHYYGTRIILLGYGVSEENTLFDKSYELFAHDTEKDVNKTRTRLVLYSENDEDDSLNALVFLYSNKTSRLVHFAKIEIGEEQVEVDEQSFILSGDAPIEYSKLPEVPDFVTVNFSQYNNADPLLVTGNDEGDDIKYEGKEDYGYEEYYLNGKNSIYISLGVLDENEDVSTVHPNLPESMALLYRKPIDNRRVIVVYEGITAD